MSGIQNQADKHIFSSVPKCQASLKYKVVGNILKIVCNIFATFFEPSPIQWSQGAEKNS